MSYALAMSLISSGELERAWNLLDDASSSTSPLTREAAQEERDALTPRVARLRVLVESAPRGATVGVGERSFDLGVDYTRVIAVPAGEQEVLVRTDSGAVVARARIVAQVGERRDLALRPLSAPTLAALSRERTSAEPSAARPSATGPSAAGPQRAPAAAVRVSGDDNWIAVGVASATVVVAASVITAIAFALAPSSGDGGSPMGSVPGIVLRGRM